MTHVWRCTDLTLVDARVSVLRILHLQTPVLGTLVVDGPKPLVTGVGVPAHCQKVDVSMPYPGHL